MGKEEDEELFAAIEAGDEERAVSALCIGADAVSPNENGAPPIFVAARYGHPKLIEILLSQGALVDQPNKNGATPIFVAALQGHSETVETLLRAEASFNQPNNKGVTPIIAAQQEGHPEVVKLLKDAGATIDSQITSLREQARAQPINRERPSRQPPPSRGGLEGAIMAGVEMGEIRRAEINAGIDVPEYDWGERGSVPWFCCNTCYLINFLGGVGLGGYEMAAEMARDKPEDELMIEERPIETALLFGGFLWAGIAFCLYIAWRSAGGEPLCCPNPPPDIEEGEETSAHNPRI